MLNAEYAIEPLNKEDKIPTANGMKIAIIKCALFFMFKTVPPESFYN